MPTFSDQPSGNAALPTRNAEYEPLTYRQLLELLMEPKWVTLARLAGRSHTSEPAETISETCCFGNVRDVGGRNDNRILEFTCDTPSGQRFFAFVTVDHHTTFLPAD